MKKRLLLCTCLLMLTPMLIQADTTQQLEQAEELIDAEKFDEAEGIYKAVIAGKGPDALLAQEKLIYLYIQQNKQDDAETAYGQLLADFSDNPGLLKAIDHVADDWREFEDFAKAREVYQYIVNTWPDAEDTVDSQRGVVLTSLLLGDYDYANESLDKLIKDYGDHRDIGKNIDFLAGEFRSIGKYAKARELYLYVVENHPQSEEAVSSLGGAIRTSFLLGDDPNAEALTQQLLSQYADNEDLPGVYDEVADEYRLARQFAKARDLYRYAVAAWPGTDRAIETRKSVVLCSIALDDEPNALADIEQLITEFNSTGTAGETAERSALLADSLVKIAKGYEQAKKFDQAKDMYQQSIARDPNNTDARLNIRKLDIILLIQSGEDENLDTQVDRLIADFNNVPECPEIVFLIGAEYYNAGAIRERTPSDQTLADSNDNSLRAIRIWNRIIENFPESIFTGWSYHYTGVCYRRMGDHYKAIENYEIVVEHWPELANKWNAHSTIACCYQHLRSRRQIDWELGGALIEQWFKEALANYPDTSAGFMARMWLEHNVESKTSNGGTVK